MKQDPVARMQKLRAIGARMDPEKVEVDRILSLPVEMGMDDEQREIFSLSRMLTSAYEAGKRLFPRQCDAVDQFERYRGGIFPLQVGGGKTGVSLMVANHAYQNLGIRKILLLIPASLVVQLTTRDIGFWRKMVPLNVPFIVLAKRTKSWRKAMTASGAPGCYIMPYSLLTQLDAVETLDAINPGLVIADEVHMLKNKRSSLTKRMMAVLNPEDGRTAPMFVGMSGTITKKKIADYHHLMSAALRTNSPLPHSASMAFVWGQMLDSTAGVMADEHMAGLMRPLVEWSKSWFPDEKYDLDQTETIRRAFKHRLNTAPGVVASSELDAIPNALVIENLPAPTPVADETFELLQEHIGTLNETSTTPNGDLLPHAMNAWKWQYELAQGFFNRLYWPSIEWMMKHRRVTEQEAKDLLDRAQIHHAYAQDFDRTLREFFKSAPIGYDTPREVGLKMAHHDKNVWPEVYRARQLMLDHDFPGRPERLSEAVRVCDWKVKHAVSWCHQLEKGQGGVVWYFNNALGKWAFETLREAGFDVFHAPAGANDEIADERNVGRIAVASIKAHHVGKNLQFWSKQLVLQWPRDSEIAEQMLGRMHRSGQEADEVHTTTTNSSEFEHAVLGACLHDTIYAAQTVGGAKRMLVASYNPMPLIFSPEFLREKGMTVQQLTAEQREMLHDRFGDFSL